ncbi:hypothetical protein G6F46_011633 [Rhizopus delemar]|uniref:Uncharacterized protein n=3 Tax=Rhizopus TaxID=4842 RepID=I1C5P4_RHIO9|nr:hypothetical protein RO3G_08479 [Rhizopus delemar RA 99-880]KAG1454800.1 hypothetical protein G6F55_007414 [Rhizopus delemar]KAG1535116.1 hypothetical protein G6F51_011715 [Rhizopus arrhizus]KAG1494739.1 hypothetical protein G6F54_007661 [Rhizopus delemar]KAG1508652.1 hypothetical protein G6F53_008032 [Rhizopus delemar]|eukprot:EIE83774.1 hypothetical protein RO3G_08479 [Rhizopus delemar RA 99-880]
MTTQEQSRCTRWRIGWLLGGEPKPCPRYPSYMLTRSHVANCLGMHQQLCLPITIPDPLSFLFNKPFTRSFVSPRWTDSWRFRWPAICSILLEVDQLQHDYLPQSTTFLGERFLGWLSSYP